MFDFSTLIGPALFAVASIFVIYLLFNFMSKKETEIYEKSLMILPDGDQRTTAILLALALPFFLLCLCSPDFKFDANLLDQLKDLKSLLLN